jgi:hypothetical protein
MVCAKISNNALRKVLFLQQFGRLGAEATQWLAASADAGNDIWLSVSPRCAIRAPRAFH